MGGLLAPGAHGQASVVEGVNDGMVGQAPEGGLLAPGARGQASVVEGVNDNRMGQAPVGCLGYQDFVGIAAEALRTSLYLRAAWMTACSINPLDYLVRYLMGSVDSLLSQSDRLLVQVVGGQRG